VSRRTIQMYLEGMSATIDVARRLEEFLNEPIVMPVDPFRWPEATEEVRPMVARLQALERELFERLERLGYEVLPTIRSPFDAFAQHDETTLLTGVESSGERLVEKARIVSNIGRVVEKDAVLFTERRTVQMTIQGLPVIAREELRRIRDRDAIEELIEERKG